MQPARRGPPRARAAFTLIEVLAVMLIFALLASVALPNLRLRSGRVAEAEALRLAAGLELARQRALSTGVPHRVVVDVDGQAWWVEWRVSEARARGEAEEPAPDVFAVEAGQPVPMAPPRAGMPDFRALAGPLGRGSRLPDEVRVVGVETGTGFAETGRAEVAFAQDGSAETTRIELVQEDGVRLVLDVRPLADAVGVRREEP
jgi:prepilin-type N-terminal cleavage/methylation domain-containing protein